MLRMLMALHAWCGSCLNAVCHLVPGEAKLCCRLIEMVKGDLILCRIIEWMQDGSGTHRWAPG